MKRMLGFLAICIAVIVIGVIVFTPLIESYHPETKYYSVGYANAKGLMEGLCLEDMVKVSSMIFEEKATPGLTDTLEACSDLIDGRLYTRIATVDFTVEGDYPEAPWSETSYVEITMDDGTTLYAIVVFLQETDGCGVTDFDLFSECPW